MRSEDLSYSKEQTKLSAAVKELKDKSKSHLDKSQEEISRIEELLSSYTGGRKHYRILDSAKTQTDCVIENILQVSPETGSDIVALVRGTESRERHCADKMWQLNARIERIKSQIDDVTKLEKNVKYQQNKIESTKRSIEELKRELMTD
eukprot:PhF_6_TR32846/c0_g2_i1/m.48350